MQENDRWGFHLEYLKIAIALSTALIAAAAAIYVDNSKIPADQSRYLLAAGVGVFFLMLIVSVVSLSYLANHLIHFPATGTPANQYRWWAVFWANASFGCLIVGALLLGGFFGLRTWNAGGPAFERAIAIARRGLDLDPAKNEAAVLKTIDLQGDRYVLTFVIAPGGGTATVTTDAGGSRLEQVRKP